MDSLENIPFLTTSEYNEIYPILLARYYGSESSQVDVAKCVSQVGSAQQGDEGLRVLLVGPGTGEQEMKLLASSKVDHLTAVEPSPEMCVALEATLNASSNFIRNWNIEQTTVNSYLDTKGNIDGPFDLILMVHSVYYISSHSETLRKVRSLLRPQTGRLILIITHGIYTTITKKYIPNSKQGYNADNLEHDLREVNIPFERAIHDVRLELTNVKGDDKLEWAYASFFIGINVVNGYKNLAKEVVDDIFKYSKTAADGKTMVHYYEHVYIIRPVE